MSACFHRFAQAAVLLLLFCATPVRAEPSPFSSPAPASAAHSPTPALPADIRPADLHVETTLKMLPPSPPEPSLGPVMRLTLREALGITLMQNPEIVIAEEDLMASYGQLREAAGPFDPQITADARTTISVLEDASTSTNPVLSFLQGNTVVQGGTAKISDDQVSIQAGIPTMLRNGITLSPVFTASGSYQGNPGNFTESVDGFLGFMVSVPLLRGLGPNNINAAIERAAGIDVQINKKSLEFAVARQFLTTITAYWELLLAQDTVRVTRSNESYGHQLVTLTEALIRGFVVPAVQIDQAKANLEQFSAQRIAAEQGQSEASQQLAMAMGLSVEQLLHEPLATDHFPEPPQELEVDAEMVKAFINLALDRRADLDATRLAVNAQKVLLRGAENDALPQIDVTFGGGGIQAGFRQQDGAQRERARELGASAGAGVSVAWPVFNDAARGRVMQQRATVGQVEAELYQSTSQVASEVITAAKGVINSRKALEQSREAAANQRKSVWAQQQLFQMGMSSLVEVITTQTDLSAIELQLLQAMQGYANAVAELRFATGTLLPDPDQDIYKIDLQALLALPEVNREN